jgi:ankyrin repeat protein
MASVRRALIKAVKERNISALKILFANGADVETRFEEGMTLLIYAAMSAPKLVVPLLNAGANVNAKNDDHCTSLLFAVSNGDAETTHILIRKGAKLDVGNKFDTTPLMVAAQGGHVDIVKMLLKAGANAKAQNHSGLGAIDYAVKNGSNEVIQALVQYGATINEQKPIGGVH